MLKHVISKLIDNEITGNGERFTLPKKEKGFRYKYPNHFSKSEGNPKLCKNQTLLSNCADFTVWGPLIEILFACC